MKTNKTEVLTVNLAIKNQNNDTCAEQDKEITDESLNSMMLLLKSQAIQYKNAGLTQVSNWL